MAVIAWRNPIQRGLCLVGITLAVVSAGALFIEVLANGPMAMAMGNWPAPFGIVFVADLLGASLALTSSIVGLGVAIYSLGDINRAQWTAGFYPLLAFLLTGVNGAFLTGDIFNLYVWFEVILIASFGLMVIGGRREQLDGAIKYAFLNLLATTFFL
ncbi:MAG: Na+/H+ antiporter subunit D, partial [Pseudomonadota bacterium]